MNTNHNQVGLPDQDNHEDTSTNQVGYFSKNVQKDVTLDQDNTAMEKIPDQIVQLEQQGPKLHVGTANVPAKAQP